MRKRIKKEKRTYVDIAFKFNDILYVERIYTDKVEKNHYEGIWTWVFGTKKNDSDPNLVFEFTADKTDDNELSLDNMYIDVYANDEADMPFKTITEIAYRKSWCDCLEFR